MVENFLKAFPYLKPVHINNLYNRFLKESNGVLLLLYNKKKDTYELHSLRSLKYTGESLNAVIPDEALNGWIIKDYRANDIRKFSTEVESDREFTNTLFDNYENKGFELLQKKALTTIEKMIGRDL
jgi:hypothetical protein